MRWSRGPSARYLHVAIGLATLALSGCATVATDPEPAEPRPEAVVEIEAPEIEIIPAPPEDPPPEIAPPPVADLPEVSIVLTSLQPAYADVARILSELLDNYTIYNLSDKTRPPVSSFRQINDSDSDAVIAIGLDAAKSSVNMANAPVVFSQVFNYQDYELLTPNTRGVAALAPLDAHLAAWQEVDSTIKRIGIVIGEGHDALIAEAEQIAEKHSQQLMVRTVRSDQEAVYQFRRMVLEIDAFWLLPDNRVLSDRSLQEILAQANQHNVPVAVPNESILSMGATISVEAVAEDIAKTIVNIIYKIKAGRIAEVPPVTSLTDARIVTNDAILNNRLSAQSPLPKGTKGE